MLRFNSFKLRHWIIFIGIDLVIIGSIIGVVLYKNSDKPQDKPSPIVPTEITKSVRYTIYYPDQNKLPAGYTLDKNSFANPVKNGVNYTVNYQDKKLVFSLQPKPVDSELDSFRANYIPLRISLQTKNGEAQLGAYNSQSLISLPIINGPWIVITAPPDINHDQLKQVLDSLIK